MLRPNNSEIDYAALERAIERTSRYARHAKPTVPVLPVTGKPRLTLRQKVRLWPIVGPLLASLYHRLRLMRAPGLGWRQRVRAMPVVGDAAVWIYAIATLPRWRQTLKDELVIAQQQLIAMKRTQQELIDEVRRLQQELDRYRDHSASNQ